MIKRLYFAKTKNNSVFTNDNCNTSIYVKKRLNCYLDFNCMPDSLKNTGFGDDIKHHRHIHLSICDKILLLFHYYIPCLV